MTISVTSHGEWDKTTKFLLRTRQNRIIDLLREYGNRGVEVLRANTPVESGETARSWSYTVERTRNGYAINWRNSHVNDGVVVAVLLFYGHGTGTGGYVEGRDYINAPMRAVFEKFADDAWREVTQT